MYRDSRVHLVLRRRVHQARTWVRPSSSASVVDCRAAFWQLGGQLGRASRAAPAQGGPSGHRPSFVQHLDGILAVVQHQDPPCEDVFEACAVDRLTRVLPGVKKLIDSIPTGRYAIATSGAFSYLPISMVPRADMCSFSSYRCMTRVEIAPPARHGRRDGMRLKASKPAPDPFLLAASELEFDAKRSVVFEDSPSVIRARVVSGAKVIALCTSHAREKIENCGAHFIVDTMEQVRIVVEGEGVGARLKFVVSQ